MPDAAWFKSSYSGGNDDNCVEAADLAGSVGVRDSKDLGKGYFAVPRTAWGDFVSTVSQ